MARQQCFKEQDSSRQLPLAVAFSSAFERVQQPLLLQQWQEGDAISSDA